MPPAPPESPPAVGRRRVFLVDDHALVREGLAKLIDQEADLCVSDEAEDAASAFERISIGRPDVVVVDISLRGDSGLELVKKLQELDQPPPVLILSMHDEASYAERALRAGALGYVMKRESTSRIIAALREVLNGKVYLSQSIAASVAGQFMRAPVAPADASPVARLSDRELEIFQRIGEGQENREIAEILGVSLKTVQTHCAHIKEKLGLANGTVLIREAVRWVESQRS